MTGADSIAASRLFTENPGERPPDISAIIVNWNTSDLLDGCLRSLSAHSAQGRTMETLVVDNGSTDGSQDMVRRAWPDVRLIANAENLGYTRANNLGIRESRGRYLLLINADAELTPGCLDRLLVLMDEKPSAGAVGPRLVYGDGRWQRWTAGREPSLSAALNYYLFLERLFPTNRAFSGLFLGRDIRSQLRCDWVSSACMLVRRAALDEVGLMDERFFVYMDDVDLCRRLRQHHWDVWYEPAAQAIHYMGQATKRQTGTVSPTALRSFNRYFAMRHGKGQTMLLKLLQAVGHGGRAALYLAASITRARSGDARLLRSSARAHWIYCRVGLEPRWSA